jgi:hypothetical protein
MIHLDLAHASAGHPDQSGEETVIAVERRNSSQVLGLVSLE